jgi:hypothetical protein
MQNVASFDCIESRSLHATEPDGQAPSLSSAHTPISAKTQGPEPDRQLSQSFSVVEVVVCVVVVSVLRIVVVTVEEVVVGCLFSYDMHNSDVHGAMGMPFLRPTSLNP